MLFSCNESQEMYGLLDTDLSHIKPNYEQMIKGGHIKVTDMGIQSKKVNVILFYLCFIKMLCVRWLMMKTVEIIIEKMSPSTCLYKFQIEH